MKKLKKIILLLIPAFLTGCTVDYRIEISNDTEYKVRESFDVYDGNINYNENLNILANNIQKRNGMYYTFGLIDDVSDYCDAEDENLINLECNIYSVSVKNGISGTNRLKTIEELKNSKVISDYFGNISITSFKNQKTIKLIPSSALGTIITDVNLISANIDNLNIYITLPNKIINSNADSKNNNTYIWNYNKNNYYNKTIELTYDISNETEHSNENDTNNTLSNNLGNVFDLKYIIISLGVIGIIIAIYLIQKKKKNNDL